MDDAASGYGLEFLLAFDGRVHHLDEGYWIKFEIKRVKPTKRRPHGVSYSLTLHAPDGSRLVGFDNAHGTRTTGARFKGAPAAVDHWHRTQRDPGGPYVFKDADTLIVDFFDEVERVLGERGIGATVVKVEEARRRK